MLAQMEELAANRSRLIGSAKGNYRLWRSPQGAELWFHYPRRPARVTAPETTATPAGASPQLERPTAVTPFHRGLSRCPIRIGRYLSIERVSPLEGSCMAWLPPPVAGGQEQVIVLELAPYGLQPLRSPPHATTAQIVCFAHALWSFGDGTAYARATPSNRRIRIGSVRPVTEADVPEVKLSYSQSPISLALATGTVRRAIRHVNPVTREPYYWLLLETQRGSFDVIVNPFAVEGDISEGHVAQVCGSFLARLAGTAV